MQIMGENALSNSLASKRKLISWRTKEVFIFLFVQLYDDDVDELFSAGLQLVSFLYTSHCSFLIEQCP